MAYSGENQQWTHQHWWMTLAAPMLSFQTICTCDECQQQRPYLFLERDEDGYREMLERDWGVRDRKALHETLQRLATCEMHGDDMLAEYYHYSCMTPMAWQRHIQTLENPMERAFKRFVALSAPHLGTAGIQGFDLSRGAYMTRAGLACGMLDDAEFEFLHSYMARRALGLFDSWHHYSLSVFYGRIYWAWSTQDDSHTEERIEQWLAGECPVRENIRISMKRIADDKDCPTHFVPWQGIDLPALEVPASIRELLEEEEAA